MSITLRRYYAVRNKEGLYYNPNKSGDRRNPTFHKKPKLYSRKSDADRAKTFCESGLNTHWIPTRTFAPMAVQIVTFEIQISEVVN